ncbi:MAG: 16S rRNA (cytosine(967)-C(5))-methyltransferase RsmB [Defluviitaleaceae bacterium]|nr:16S rRNA (cytosine(967)-C(5))-methyltransferase RsmB [Defluviitaleaceae bacterium]
MTNKTDRAIAVSVLTDVLDSGAYANIALRKTLAEVDIDPRARAFVTDLVNETLRNLIQIDYAINKYSKTPVDKMKPFIRNLLRISVCQIKFMDKIPDRAAVNEAVVLTKNFGFTNLAGFVNAVLRNISRESADKIKSPALKYSYPKWLIEKLNTWLGEAEAHNFCENSHQPPPLIIVANTYKITPADLLQQLKKEEIDAASLDDAEDSPFLILRQAGDITRLPSFKDGLFSVMDPGAMHAVYGVNPQPGQTIVDMCAAPGGKSFAMAARMQNNGNILSYDIYPHRIELINQTRKRLGLSIVTPLIKDATVFDPALEGAADAVLLDAPCSGFGTIRKHPEIKYTRTLQDIKELAALQQDMLAVAARYVKPGGKLVYCTCTVTTEENGDNIKRFLENHPQFKLESETQYLPSPTSDAFYVAVLAL